MSNGQKKRLPNTDINLSKTRCGDRVIDGLGETLLPQELEWREAYTGVQLADAQYQTNLKNWITQNQLWSQHLDSLAGTITQNAYYAGQPVLGCYAPLAMTQRPEEKMNEGKKYDSEKPAMALLSPKGLEEEAKGMTYGAKKYGMYNWRNGIVVTRYISAALRHIFAFLRGEDLDPESGVSHLGHAKCNLGMALQALEDNPKLDDRFKGEGK